MTHFDSHRSGVSQIECIGVSVANLEAAQDFYTGALGFRTVGLETRQGEVFAALTGVHDARARVAVMQLGEQTLELVEFANRGAPYPEPRAANDPWFQHFAIAVRDMDQAFAALSRSNAQPISHGGPQRLPPSTGDVVAYKFRDPDGHPLELSQAPQSPWTGMSSSTAQSTLGIDHSGLAVADLDASLRLYTFGLGLRLGAPSLNQGPEQARLDGLDDPVVDIATLRTAQTGPHLELLHYRRPKSVAPPSELCVHDIAAVRLVMRTETLDLITQRALQAGAVRVSRMTINTPTGRRILLRDPDNHFLELVGPNG